MDLVAHHCLLEKQKKKQYFVTSQLSLDPLVPRAGQDKQ